MPTLIDACVRQVRKMILIPLRSTIYYTRRQCAHFLLYTMVKYISTCAPIDHILNEYMPNRTGWNKYMDTAKISGQHTHDIRHVTKALSRALLPYGFISFITLLGRHWSISAAHTLIWIRACVNTMNTQSVQAATMCAQRHLLPLFIAM